MCGKQHIEGGERGKREGRGERRKKEGDKREEKRSL